MKGDTAPLGYTIVEVMIVLAVSGVMFLIAANFIGGRQQSVSFTQGVNELASNIQNTIEEVSDGKYSDVDLSCSFSYPSSAATAFVNGTGGSTQGQNTNCIFLGKVLHFNIADGVSGATPAEQYETLTLAGGRLDNANTPVYMDAAHVCAPLDNDGPVIVGGAPGNAVGGLTTIQAVPQLLDVIDVSLQTIGSVPATPGVCTVASGSTSYGIGFLQDLGTANEAPAKPIDLYYVAGLGANTAVGTGNVNGTTLMRVPVQDDIVMCISDGVHWATINLGNENNQLAVDVKMLGTTPCS